MIRGRFFAPTALQVSVEQCIRGFSSSAPLFSVKHVEEEMVDRRAEYFKDKATVVRAPISEPQYYKEIERYVKSQRKGGKMAVSDTAKAVKEDGTTSAVSAGSGISPSMGTISPTEINSSNHRSRQDGQDLKVAGLEDITGWGAHWQQGGTGSQRWNYHFKPTYSMGMGDRERYIGYLKRNPLQYYPNRCRGISSTDPVPDHTRNWSKPVREMYVKKSASHPMDEKNFYATGFRDEWGNHRGRIQRWPSLEFLPTKRY